jgi:ankyrin repeat protein
VIRRRGSQWGLWAAVVLLGAGVPGVSRAQGRTDGGAAAGLYAVPDGEVREHEIWPHKPVRRGVGEKRIFQEAVRMKLVVDEQGNVVSAEAAEDSHAAYRAAAVEEAKRWKYVPFEKDGVAVKAGFEDYVRILPAERLPTKQQAFPTLNGTKGVVMALSRSRCYGTCPAYRVEIHGDGTVIYSGEEFVVVKGVHSDHLSKEAVEELIETFRKTDYFSLEEEYRAQITDQPTYATSFAVDQVKWGVTDYAGERMGMPQAVTDLEETIDRVADTKKWIKGTEETVPTLERGRFNFRSEEAEDLLSRAAAAGSAALVKALLAEGVSVNGKTERGQTALTAAAGIGNSEIVEMLIKAGAGKNNVRETTAALGAAAKTGDAKLVEELLAHGGKAGGVIHDAEGTRTVLMDAAASGVGEVVEKILSAHPDLNARDGQGRTAVWYVINEGTYWDEKRHADRAEAVRMLAKAGVDLNAQDNEGNGALHGTFQKELAAALIQEGANVNLRNNRGETPLMTTSSLEVMKLLVAAGADVKAKDEEGKTALDHVMEEERAGEREKYLRGLGGKGGGS